MPRPVFGADRDDGRPLAQARLEPRADVLELGLGDVPLREHDQGRVLRLAGDVGDGQVLVDEPLARVDEHEGHVGALGSRERPQLRVVLDPLALLALAADPGGVDEHEGAVAALEHGVDRVARRARHLGDDHALLAEQRVQEARLADVRPAEDRYADRLLADLLRAAAGEHRHDRVEQVARAVAVLGRERHRVAEAEAVELERERVLRRVVDLVRQQQHRLVGAPQDRRQLLVAGRDPGARVDDEQDQVGLARSPRAPARRSSA